jgi:hypothetical protein
MLRIGGALTRSGPGCTVAAWPPVVAMQPSNPLRGSRHPVGGGVDPGVEFGFQ